jgi:tRNA nucleotidyltransferase/poly(A) polymerase
VTTRAAAGSVGDGDIPSDVRQAALGRALQALAGLAKASDKCVGAHLVGGALRNALLGRLVIEADVVVPSDAHGCADALARAIPASATFRNVPAAALRPRSSRT